jgi:Asp-tRNA(Asn)/Glu-tRNA(Gln) amidotransferase A subunit family amidase
LHELVGRIESPDIKKLYESCVVSDKYTAEQYDKAVSETKPRLKLACRALFKDMSIHAMVYPTMPCLPVRFVDVNETTDEICTRNMNTAALADMPSISIPMGALVSSRMPVGLSFDGLEGEDKLVLDIAKLAEALFSQSVSV